MIAGLLGLAFNPSFWIALGLTAAISFSGGVFKGWTDSRADQYQTEIIELRKASKRKDEIIRQDAERQLTDLQEKSQLEAKLHDILKGINADSCRLSEHELGELQSLANAAGGQRR